MVTQGGYHVAMRNNFGGLERRYDCNRFAPRALEELRQRLVAVLRRQDLGQLDDARDAQPTIAERLDDLWKSLDQIRRRLTVVRGVLRSTELTMQEVEEAGV